MTYEQIFNLLDKEGLIEKILVESYFDNLGLIKGIQHLEDFIDSDSFFNMKYWICDGICIAVCVTCREFSNLFKQQSEEYNYMYSLYELRTRFNKKAQKIN